MTTAKEYVNLITPNDRAAQTQRYLRRLCRYFNVKAVPSVEYHRKRFTFTFTGHFDLTLTFAEKEVSELGASDLAAYVMGIYQGKFKLEGVDDDSISTNKKG